MAYRIATLIHFYNITMERTIGPEALMSTVLAECVRQRNASPSHELTCLTPRVARITDHAYAAFFETLKAQGRSLLRFIQVRYSPAPSFSAPPDASPIASRRCPLSPLPTSRRPDNPPRDHGRLLYVPPRRFTIRYSRFTRNRVQRRSRRGLGPGVGNVREDGRDAGEHVGQGRVWDQLRRDGADRVGWVRLHGGEGEEARGGGEWPRREFDGGARELKGVDLGRLWS
jgi:hypothetical protein